MISTLHLNKAQKLKHSLTTQHYWYVVTYLSLRKHTLNAMRKKETKINWEWFELNLMKYRSKWRDIIYTREAYIFRNKYIWTKKQINIVNACWLYPQSGPEIRERNKKLKNKIEKYQLQSIPFIVELCKLYWWM